MSRSTTTLAFLCLVLSTAFPALAPAATVNATLGVDPNGLAGADSQGRVLMFAPNPLQRGSSVSHFDRSATPNLLMEPSASANLPFGRVDLTLPLFQDIGWQTGSSNVALSIVDGPGLGFNDPQLGAQRTTAIQFAANTWSQILRSSIPIRVEVGFESLTCGDGSGVLAQASPQFAYDNFAGAPVANTWYPGALAESLSGQNLSLQDNANPNAADIRVTFNSAIDNSCLGSGSRYYYGLDGNLPANTISFVQVALHEIAHGLGFSSFANEATGSWFFNQPDIYSRFLLDNTSNLTWPQMSEAQRVASAINTSHLVWSGTRVTNQAPTVLRPGPALTIGSPASIAGRYQVGTANFGPTLQNPGISGEVVRAFDGSAEPTLACNPLINGPQINGRIALIDRGNCNFTDKVRNAQAAGARGVIVVNNVAGGTVQMGGSDSSITIPSVSVSRSDGMRIVAALEEADPAGNLQLTAATVQVAEGAGILTLGVERVGGTTGAVAVDYATANGTAVAGQDYVATSGTLQFAAGEAGPQTITVPLLDDGDSEDAETFRIELSNPTGEAGLGIPRIATATIADDEPCIQSDTVSCLENGRFRVSVRWRDFDDATGDGRPVVADVTDSTLLWFFEAENWEMLVKVINGCGFNQNFWVFAAATTNVEFTLRITDTDTGVIREYTNPLGTSAPALTDIEAFATCP